MADSISITAVRKQDIYEQLLPQLRALLEGENDPVANMANTTAALRQAFSSVSWVGFYLIRGGVLVLGPFQGKPACVRIAPGRGVCGTAFAKRETIIVPDVGEFPGHIACDAGSRSEIVVPLHDSTACYGVLDLDSYALNAFDVVDAAYLEKVAALIVPFLRKADVHGEATH